MRLLVVTLIMRHIPQAIERRRAAIRTYLSEHPQDAVDVVEAHGDNPYKSGYNNVVHKYRRLQATFLAGDWDALVTFEDDLLLPADALLRGVSLLEDGADIGYGLYVWRRKPHRWSAYTQVLDHGGTSLSEDPPRARAKWGQVVPVAGVGLGCTFIKRHVLDRFPFRRGGTACNDWYLAQDAQRAGFNQRCDLGLVCGHTDEVAVYWPDPDGKDLYREGAV